MKIRALTCIAGVDVVRNFGEVFECEAAEAARFIEAGFAEPVRDAAPVERASASPGETTDAAPTPRKPRVPKA